MHTMHVHNPKLIHMNRQGIDVYFSTMFDFFTVYNSDSTQNKCARHPIFRY